MSEVQEPPTLEGLQRLARTVAAEMRPCAMMLSDDGKLVLRENVLNECALRAAIEVDGLYEDMIEAGDLMTKAEHERLLEKAKDEWEQQREWDEDY